MSEMSNTEEREDTACIEITCSVKGYQECNFTVDVGEEFFTFKKIGSKGRAFKVTTDIDIDILAVWCSDPVYSIKADNVLLSLRRQETIALD